MDLGFRPGGIAALAVDVGLIGYDETRAKQLYERATERIRTIPGRRICRPGAAPAAGDQLQPQQHVLPGAHEARRHRDPDVRRRRWTTSTSRRSAWRLLRGRNFSAGDCPRPPRTAIVNGSVRAHLLAGRRRHRQALPPAHGRWPRIPSRRGSSPTTRWRPSARNRRRTSTTRCTSARSPDEVLLARTTGEAGCAPGRDAARRSWRSSRRRWSSRQRRWTRRSRPR